MLTAAYVGNRTIELQRARAVPPDRGQVRIHVAFVSVGGARMVLVGEMVGDIERCAVFDTTKIRTFVPRFAARPTFHRAAGRMIAWRAAHPESTKGDQSNDAVLTRIVHAHRAAKGAFVAYTPAASGGTS